MADIKLKGVDISGANGNVDFNILKKNGISFVMINLGNNFADNVKKAETVGMPWGAYYYTYSTSATEDKEELDKILSRLKGKKPTYPIAIDIEDSDGYKQRHGGWNYTNVSRNAKYMLEGLEKAGYYPMLYTGFEEIENYIDKAIWTKYDMWFAHWAKKCGYTGNNLTMWQFGGETNLICSPYIGGAIFDQNYCYKDYPTIIKNGGYNNWSKSSGSTTPVTPTPTPTPNVNSPSIYIQGVAGGKWLKVIKDGSTYSGALGKALVALAAKVTEGTITYSVHLTGGKWLGNITGWNYKDYINGYAGSGNPAQNGASIDAIKMYYKTPQNIVSKYGYYKVAYRVHLINGSWLDWQYDTETTNGQDGYAGIFGTIIDGVQVKLVKA